MIRPLWSTIRGRLLAYLLPPLVLLLAAGVYLDYETGAAPVRAAYDHALAAAALAIATHAESGTQPAELARIASAIDPLLHPAAGARAYFVVHAGGRYLAGDADLPVATLGARNPVFFDARFRGEAVRVVTYSLTGAQPLSVSVAETTAERDRATLRLLVSEVLTDIVQLVATVVLVWIGVALALRPMLRLGEQIATRSPRELSPLDADTAPGEARLLVTELNRLFAALGEASRVQQHFLANAAHQMRTPLAGLLIQLDLLIAEAADGRVREELLALRQSAQNLAHTADQLLTLARADPAVHLANEFTAVDCGKLITDVVAQNLDRALVQGIDLGAQIEPVRLAGVAWLIREVLTNLVDNAIRYVPAGGHVTVRCGIAGGLAYLEVEDDGPGIPPAERQAVRQRFYRLPNTPGSGCGLGLAIADEVARLHGAELEIGDCDGVGTRVRLRFPQARGPLSTAAR
ncbi:MAG TPA: sensor histidine kinase [Steroidobacteraceae bacterium]|nr:sensor histidine kinase [Steroidobacteraceae bacterium]